MDIRSSENKRSIGLYAVIIAFLFFSFVWYLKDNITAERTHYQTPNALPIDLPELNIGANLKDAISLSLLGNGTVYVGSELVSENRLENELKSLLGVKKGKRIMLKAERNSSTGDLVRILDMAKRNDWRITMATKPE